MVELEVPLEEMRRNKLKRLRKGNQSVRKGKQKQKKGYLEVK